MKTRDHRPAVRALARLCAVSIALSSVSQAADADLLDLNLEELAQLKVTSVSKRAESLHEAPAAIHVITAEDIEHSGTTLLPETLRHVPGVQVARAGAHTWAISSRGFNNVLADKLEVRMDGRTLYTPLFSGVLWDQQLVPLERIDRIEIVRGPAGTLWGSNAVNGVININTRHAALTPGLVLSGGVGDELEERYAMGLGTDAFGGNVRFDVSTQKADAGLRIDPEEGPQSDNDGWEQVHQGFRGDWGDWALIAGRYDGDLGGDLAPIRVEGHHVVLKRAQAPDQFLSGSLLLSWDDTSRAVEDGFAERRRTGAVGYERAFTLAEVHDLVWGIGYRRSEDQVTNTETLVFDPAQRTIDLVDGFIQDSWRLDDRLTLTAGTKLEHNDFTGFEYQPGVRIAWSDPRGSTFWGAVSRAVRTPNRLDHDARLVGAAMGTPEDFGDELGGGVPVEPPGGFEEPTVESCTEAGGDPVLCTLLFGTDVIPVDRPGSYEECREAGLGPTTCEALFDQNLERDLVGNRDFKSEEVLALELGWRRAFGPAFNLDTALFYSLYDDLRGVHTEPDGTAVVSNEIEGTGYGAELLLTWRPADAAQFNLGYSYLHVDLEPKPGSNDTRTEASEGNNPEHQAYLRFLWRPVNRVGLQFALRHVGELPNQDIPAYTELNTHLTWRIASGVTLGLSHNNALNSSHAEFGSQVPGEIERSTFLTVRLGP